MSVAENLGFGLKLRGASKDEIARRVGEAAAGCSSLDRCSIASPPRCPAASASASPSAGRWFANRRCSCSTNPCSNLDAKLRASTRVEIARLHRQLGTTMIYVTHDQIEAMTLGQRIVVLDKGRIQQIDTPMGLYNRPANLFVATFLGSPGMNLLGGDVVEHDGLHLRMADGVELPLRPAPELAERVRGYLGRPLTVGLRPEDMHLAAAGPGHFAATVEGVEPVGNEAFLDLACAGRQLVLRLAPRNLPEIGDTVHLGHDAGQMHYFDPGTGVSLRA